MKSDVLKVSDCEEDPCDETQMAQCNADGGLDETRHVNGQRRRVKSFDDYLPMLKYGTPLPRLLNNWPAPTAIPRAPPQNRRRLVVITKTGFTVGHFDILGFLW